MTNPTPETLRDIALATLEDTKAEDVVMIDVRGKTSIADYMIVASGRSSRQAAAMAEHLKHNLTEAGTDWLRIQGLPQGDWVLVDAGDVVIHLFRPEVRAYYNIEKMWEAVANARTENPAPQ